MFLWASLAWAFFTDGVGIWTKKIIAQRLQVLQHLLPGMESLYQRILDEVGLRYRNDLLHSLHLIVSAAKPLTVDDLSIALASRERRDGLRDIDPRLNVQAFFRSACPHLIKIGKTGMVTLVHLSCKDYLIGAPMMNNKPNNSHIDALLPILRWVLIVSHTSHLTDLQPMTLELRVSSISFSRTPTNTGFTILRAATI